MSAFRTMENDISRHIDQGNRVNFSHTFGDFNEAGRPGFVDASYGVVDGTGKSIDWFGDRFENAKGQTYKRRVG